MEGNISMSGSVTLKVIKPEYPQEPHPLTFGEILHYGFPRFGLSKQVNIFRLKNLPNLFRGAWRVAVARLFRISNICGTLYLKVVRANGAVEDYGLASLRVVTTTGVGFIVDGFQNLVELENMKYHGIGTGVAAEASGDTALGTELTTQYNPDSTRATGTTTENGANVYRTVGTNTVDATVAITEHGILSQSATGGGVLLDRSVFSALNLVSGDSIQSTYDLTLTAGS